MAFSKLSIVIPCYNEEKTVHLILDKVRNVDLKGGIKKEIIIVNDCSTDNTKSAIENYFQKFPDVEYKLYNHEVNKGKGAAIHTGIKQGTGINVEQIKNATGGKLFTEGDIPEMQLI